MGSREIVVKAFNVGGMISTPAQTVQIIHDVTTCEIWGPSTWFKTEIVISSYVIFVQVLGLLFFGWKKVSKTSWS